MPDVLSSAAESPSAGACEETRKQRCGLTKIKKSSLCCKHEQVAVLCISTQRQPPQQCLIDESTHALHMHQGLAAPQRSAPELLRGRHG